MRLPLDVTRFFFEESKYINKEAQQLQNIVWHLESERVH